MKLTHSLILLSTILLIVGCNKVQDPILKGIENVEILDANKDKISLDAELVFDNPNGFNIDMDRASLVAYLDDMEVATFEQKLYTSMKAHEEFHMPFHIDIDLKRIYSSDPMFAITKGIKIMKDRKVLVKYKGTVFCGHGKLKIPIDVDREEWIAF